MRYCCDVIVNIQIIFNNEIIWEQGSRLLWLAVRLLVTKPKNCINNKFAESVGLAGVVDGGLVGGSL